MYHVKILEEFLRRLKCSSHWVRWELDPIPRLCADVCRKYVEGDMFKWFGCLGAFWNVRVAGLRKFTMRVGSGASLTYLFFENMFAAEQPSGCYFNFKELFVRCQMV